MAESDTLLIQRLFYNQSSIQTSDFNAVEAVAKEASFDETRSLQISKTKDCQSNVNIDLYTICHAPQRLAQKQKG